MDRAFKDDLDQGLLCRKTYPAGMSLRVTLGRPRGEPVTFGPFGRLSFFGRELRADLEAHPLATHVDHSWLVQGERFSRIDVPGPLMIDLNRPSQHATRRSGPFTAFSCVDGVAYVEGRVFAFVDNEMGDWYCLEDNRHWAYLGLAAA